MPISVSLTLLVGVVVTPALGFGVVLLDRYAAAEQAGNIAATENIASRAADALDREIARLVGTLNEVAMLSALHVGQLQEWAAHANAATAGGRRHLVVTTPDGREVFRSGGARRDAPWLPAPNQPPASNLSVDPDGMLVHVSIPVRSGTLLPPFLPRFELPAPVLWDVLRAQPFPRMWVASIVDATDRVISRTVEADRFVGQPATADFRANAIHDEGSWVGTTLTGVPALTGYARLHLAPWRVGVGAPVDLVERPWRRALLLLTGGGGALVLLSVLLAVGLARQITRPLHDLAAAGGALSRGEVLGQVVTGVREVASVAQALRQASVALRHRTEALDAERTRLAAIIETVPVGLLIVAADMTMVSGNAQMGEITGRAAGAGRVDMRGLDLRMSDGSVVPQSAWPTVRAFRGEASPELECRLHRPDGTCVWVYLIAAPILDRAGHVSSVVLAALDIEEVVRARDEKARSAIVLEQQVADRTGQLERSNARLRDEIASRTEAEAQLRQVQKMEAVGQLTGGIAHDFNNLLTIVIGCLDMLRNRVADDRSRRLADNALDGAQRAATLTARLLAFSRQQPLAPRALDPNRLVAGMAELLRRTLGEHVRLDTRLDPAAWLVHADPNQLENALLNLAVNAKDAIAGLPGEARGSLVVGTANVAVAAGAFVDLAAGDYVCLTVSDTGMGMTPEVMGRVFEPFFTTKPVGQGTGLGLSQVHGFVKQSGGHVTVASRTVPGPAHGTDVAIYLPREPGVVDHPAPAPAVAMPAPAAAHGTILVVEDEPGVRSLACEALTELGYTVIGTDAVAQALAILDRSPEVALLFTDMVLPESSGRALAEEARRRRPALPILFTTGHTGDRALREGRLNQGEALIDKPYTVGQLAASVAALLA